MPLVAAENGKGTRTFYVLDGKQYSASSLTAVFTCKSCASPFKVEYNPSRYHLDSLVCKRCKKQVVHKCADYKERYERSMLANHGVKHPFQSEEIFSKFKTSMQANHGVNFSGECPELLAKTRKHTKFNGRSKLEILVGRKLQELYGVERVQVDPSQKIPVSNTRWIYPDILIDNHFIVEVYGDYWHGNPRLYKPTSIVSHCHLAEEVWKWDANRVDLATQAGYSVLIVWEYDWKRSQEKVLAKINEAIRTPLPLNKKPDDQQS